jgi:hypothetical protein
MRSILGVCQGGDHGRIEVGDQVGGLPAKMKDYAQGQVGKDVRVLADLI